MKNLGKYLIIFLVLIKTVFAVEAKVDKEHIIKGESVTLTITAKGEKVKFPSISKIGDYKIEAVSVSNNIITKNGKLNKSVSKYYTFTPLKSLTIPSYEVIIDDHIQKTEPIKIDVKKENPSSMPPFTLDMYIDKKNVYIGEPIHLTIIFRKKIGVDIQDIEFTPPSFENFWKKELRRTNKEITGSYVVQKIEYMLFAQKAGKLHINEAVLNIGLPARGEGIFNMIFNRIKWRKIFSNSLDVDVKPLPDNIKVYGKFSLDVKADKKEIKANSPVNLTISIKGEGNIDDIDSYKIDISNAAVYADKAVKKTFLQNKRYGGEFSQKFAIVSEEDFVIPSVSFSYFDKEKKRVITLKSEPINITVTGKRAKESPKLQKGEQKEIETKDVKMHSERFYILALVTFIMGLLIGFLIKNFKFQPKIKETSIQKKIKNAKNNKDLLKILLPYVDRSKEIKEIVFALESSLYNGGGYKIDKKTLIKNIDSYLNPSSKEDEFSQLL